MVPKLFRISSLARTLSLSSLLLILLPAGGSASTPAPAPPAPPAPPARMAKTSPPTPPAPEADSDDQDHPKRGWLGVFLSEDEDGVIVTGVKDGSPADKAGLKEGDKIVEIDGKKVDDSDDLRHTIRQLEPGDTVQVVVMRDNKKKSVNATLGEAPQHFWGGEGFSGWAPGEGFGPIGFPGMGVSKTYLGVRVQGMTEELRVYFKAPRGRGVLVSRVDEDTPAGKAGLRAGDVIIAVDGKGIANRGDIGAALADKEAGDKVAVKIVRDGSEKTIDVEVAERPTPKAHHGALSVPDEDKAFWMDQDDEEDLEDIHDHDMDAVPDNSRIQLEIERALREAHRAMKDSTGYSQEIQREIHRAMEQAQVAQLDAQRQIQQEMARVKDSSLLQKEEIRRQVSAAMDQAREAIREAAEAARRTEDSSGI